MFRAYLALWLLPAATAVSAEAPASSQAIAGPHFVTSNYELVVWSAGHFGFKVGERWLPGCVCLNVNGVPQYKQEALSHLACRGEITPDGRRFTITGRLTPEVAFTETLECTDVAVTLTYEAEALSDLTEPNLTVTASPQFDNGQGLCYSILAEDGKHTGTYPPAEPLFVSGVQSITIPDIGRRNVRTVFVKAAESQVRLSGENSSYRATPAAGGPLRAGEKVSAVIRFEAEPIGEAASWVRTMQGRVGQMRFGVSGMSGLVNNIRTDRGLLIQYLSLNEQDTHQVQIGRGRGEAWGGVKVAHGDPGQAYQIEARGRIESEWDQVVTARTQSPTVDALHLRATRSQEAEPRRLRLLMYMAQWLEEERVPYYIRTPDGNVKREQDGHSLWFGYTPDRTAPGSGPNLPLGTFPAGTEVLVPMPGRGELLRVRTGQELELCGFRFEIYFRGLWFEAPRPDAPGIEVTVEVETLPFQQVGPLSVVEDPLSGAMTVSAGGTPLLEGISGSVGGLATEERWVWSSGENWAEGKLVVGSVEKPGGASVGIPQHLFGKPLSIRAAEGLVMTEHEGVPLRLGAEIRLPALTAGGTVELSPSALERVSLHVREAADCKLVTVEPGRNLLQFGSHGAPLELTVRYSRVSEPVRDAIAAQPVAAGWEPALPGPYGGLEVKRDAPDEGDVTVSTPWWEVVHSAKRGGAISSIRFFHGTDENILREPVGTWLQAGDEYSDLHDSAATVEVLQARPEYVRVHVTGRLMTEGGDALGPLEHLYEYRPLLVRRTCRYTLPETGVDCTGLSVGHLELPAHFTEGAARRLGERTSWFRAVFPNPPAFDERTFSEYMSLYARGIEGIDWLPAAALDQWQGFGSGEPGGARYAIAGNEQGLPGICIEPIAWDSEPVTLKGTYTFESYLSLPQVQRCLPRRNFVACLDTGQGSEELLKLCADRGVTDILLGAGNTPGSFELSDLAAVREVVARAHRYGLKVYPFDPFQLVNRKATMWEPHHEEWGREELRDGKPTLRVYSDYGDYFCPTAPGFLQALKDGYTKLIGSAGFDGNYHDFTHPYACWNTRHYPKPHMNTDGVLEEVLWEREFLGKDGVFCGHTGWTPVLFFQDLCTVTAVFEEYPASQPLPLYLTPAQGEGVNAAQRTLVSSFLAHGGNAPGEEKTVPPPPELVDAYLARCALVGIFPWAHAGMVGATDALDLPDKLRPWLRLFSLRGDWDLGSMQFLPYHRQTAALSDNPWVRAATYWNEREAIVVLANSESATEAEFTVRLLPEQFGWPADSRLSVKPTADSPTLQTDETGNTFRGSLPGFGWGAWQVTRG